MELGQTQRHLKRQINCIAFSLRGFRDETTQGNNGWHDINGFVSESVSHRTLVNSLIKGFPAVPLNMNTPRS